MTDTMSLVTLGACVLAALLFVGCGNQALTLNAEIARGMLTVQSESGPVIRQLRITAGVEAGREAHSRGLSEGEALILARSAADEWQCAIDGHGIYTTAVGSYINALALWNAGEDFQLADVLPFVMRGLDAYRFLASCLTNLGSDLLPEAPRFLGLIPSGWSMQHGE